MKRHLMWNTSIRAPPHLPSYYLEFEHGFLPELETRKVGGTLFCAAIVGF